MYIHPGLREIFSHGLQLLYLKNSLNPPLINTLFDSNIFWAIHPIKKYIFIRQCGGVGTKEQIGCSRNVNSWSERQKPRSTKST